MLSKNDIKHIRSLSLGKNRKKFNCFVAEGKKVVHELMDSSLNILNIYGVYENPEWLEKTNYHKVSNKELSRISQLKTPQELLAVVEIPARKTPHLKSLSKSFVLAFDRIQDPGNLGTMVRTADWFGIKHVICSSDCVDVFGSKALQATMGSVGRVQVHYVDLPAFLAEQKKAFPELNIAATSLEGSNLFETKFPDGGVLVFGNESKGVSAEILALSNQQLKIPSIGKAESLNVAVSAGIVMANLCGKA